LATTLESTVNSSIDSLFVQLQAQTLLDYPHN